MSTDSILTVGSKRFRFADTFHSFLCARYVPRMQSLSVSNRHAPLPGLFLGSPTDARHLGFSVVPVRDKGLWNATQIVLMFVLRGRPSAREQRVGTRHSLIVLMFVLRGRPSAQSFAIVFTLLSKQKHPHCR